MAHNITEACIGCTACAKQCPVFAISGERGSRHVINAKRCVDCGVCGRICPKSAITGEKGDICRLLKRSAWPKPQINTETCSACAVCVSYCVAGALRISAPQFRGDIRPHAELAAPSKCVACALCERYCPVGAVVMAAKDAESGAIPQTVNALVADSVQSGTALFTNVLGGNAQ